MIAWGRPCGCGNICERERRGRKIGHMCNRGTGSDREGNKAVVLLNVSLQDVGAGTQDSLKPWSVQFDTLEGSACNNSGSPRPVHQ